MAKPKISPEQKKTRNRGWTILTITVVAITALVGIWRGFSSDNTKTNTITTATTQTRISSSSNTAQTQPFQIEIPLLGENTPSEKQIDIDNDMPMGWDYRAEGPREAMAHFSDGTVIPIWGDAGVKGGTVYYTGPAKGKVIVRCMPHGTKWVQPAQPVNSSNSEEYSVYSVKKTKTVRNECCKKEHVLAGTVVKLIYMEGYLVIRTEDGKTKEMENVSRNIPLYLPNSGNGIIPDRIWAYLCPGDQIRIVYDSRGLIQYFDLLERPEPKNI